jgi:hypothetical protein
LFGIITCGWRIIPFRSFITWLVSINFQLSFTSEILVVAYWSFIIFRVILFLGFL